ncbi:MAG: thiamine phosphate synthase [Gammaproteobacteria bacterium]|nr:thiamine phosphate synthase [Gammaproteobacteria bacterium]
MKRPELRGLYAITDSQLTPPESMLVQVKNALDGGARMIQYRDKGSDSLLRRSQAADLLRLCHLAGVPLIINDDVDLALTVAADGVHLGRDDPQLKSCRERLGPKAIIGVSCYNDFDRALQAQHDGADYIAFGRFFVSNTKPNAVQADIRLLQRARRELNIPAVAIGGITPENGAALVAAGADMLAVIHALFGQPDIHEACQHFARLFVVTGESST